MQKNKKMEQLDYQITFLRKIIIFRNYKKNLSLRFIIQISKLLNQNQKIMMLYLLKIIICYLQIKQIYKNQTLHNQKIFFSNYNNNNNKDFFHQINNQFNHY